MEHEPIEANGALWIVEEGVILRKAPYDGEWALWDPDDRGARPPEALIEETGEAHIVGASDLARSGDPDLLAWAREQVASSAGVLYFIETCTYLAGSLSLAQGRPHAILFTTEAVHLLPHDAEEAVPVRTDGIRMRPHDLQEEVVELDYSELLDIHLSGPGEVTSDAGIWGGGFGLEGAAQGIAIASVINSLTRRTTINTFLKIDWRDGEAFYHYTRLGPEQLRMAMSKVFVKLRGRSGNTRLEQSRSATRIDELEKLASLFERGLLDEGEYRALKKRLIEE